MDGGVIICRDVQAGKVAANSLPAICVASATLDLHCPGCRYSGISDFLALPGWSPLEAPIRTGRCTLVVSSHLNSAAFIWPARP